MPYYPKNRVIINQKSNPGEFFTSDGKEYLGDYYITFDGKYFQGTDPNNSTNIPLFKTESNKQQNKINIYTKDSIIFNKLNPTQVDIQELKEPVPYYPKPREEDYKKGKITRYFAKQRKISTFKIIEINKETFESIDQEREEYNYPLWKITSLFWMISGPLHDERPNGTVIRAGVIDTNQRIVETKEKTFFGIKQYLTDYKQFYEKNN